ncbi:MAG TPA: HAMP domain-containing sensor histidine kinase [Polyangia bacterium]|nr:HAMP domain-containing sensor histidine kinase [Polyangia bacterium]
MGVELEQAVRDTFADEARRWERGIFVARFLFVIFLATRMAVIWNSPGALEARSAWMTKPMLLVVALYLAATTWVARSRWPIERVVWLSVLLDAVGAFLALAPNALWPWKGYSGLINMPDTSGVILMTLAAGLRLSPGAAIFGGVLNGCSFVALTWIDLRVSGLAPGARLHQHLLYGVFLVSTASVAVIIAVRTRRLVVRVARAAAAAAQARHSFGAILHQHHDVRTQLSAARLDADLLARSLASRGRAGRAPDEIVDHLRDGLRDVEAGIDAIRAQSFGQLLALDDKLPVDVAAVAGEVLARLGRRFSGASLALRSDGEPRALVAGGSATLRRILFNLVINSCEGDGERGAGLVEIRVRTDGRQVLLEVVDDGPGFPPASLAAPPGETPSTKAEGSGMGLGVAVALAEASDGKLRLHNGAHGGAVVSVSLPAVVHEAR